MREIEDAAAELVAHPVRPPTPMATLAHTVKARRRRLGAIVTAVVVVAAGSATALAVSASGGGPTERVSTGPASATMPSSGAGVTPPGFVRVDYGNASIAVPAGWRVLTGVEAGCPAVNDAVLLGDAATSPSCPGEPTSYARLGSLSGTAQSGTPVEVNGHRGIRLPATGGSRSERVAYPDLGVVLSVAGTQAPAIAGTIGWSMEYLALHPAGAVSVPAGWKTIAYGGLELRVPAAWPVQQLGRSDTDPGACGPDEFRAPQVYEGVGGSFPSCPPMVTAVTSGVDGVWIRPYQNATPPAGARSLRSGGLQVMVAPEPASVYAQPVLRLLVRSSTAPFVSIDIGLGPDTLTASNILASLSTVPHVPIATRPVTVPANPVTTTTSTTMPAGAQTALDGYVAQAAAGDAAAATQAGQAWNGSLHSGAVTDEGALIAVAAFSYDPSGHPVQVLLYRNGRWAVTAALPAPQGGSANSYWVSNVPGVSISVTDATGDGRPDFLIPEGAADNTPGAVLSQDGPSGQWRYIPFTGPFPSSDTVGRNPQFRANTVTSIYDSCRPDCASGSSYTITWTYERSQGVFWAPDPPGWTAPPGATNHA